MSIILQNKAISHFIICSAITFSQSVLSSAKQKFKIFIQIYQSVPLCLLGNRYFKFYFVTWKFLRGLIKVSEVKREEGSRGDSCNFKAEQRI